MSEGACLATGNIIIGRNGQANFIAERKIGSVRQSQTHDSTESNMVGPIC